MVSDPVGPLYQQIFVSAPILFSINFLLNQNKSSIAETIVFSEDMIFPKNLI